MAEAPVVQVSHLLDERGITSFHVHLIFWSVLIALFDGYDIAAIALAAPHLVADWHVPRSALGPVLDEIAKLSAESGIRVANVFHAGDGNLHPLVLYDDSSPEATEAAEELSGAILDLCISYGGSITGEHGVGVDKSRYMPKMFGADDLDTMQLLRCAFDPAGLCNPGKVFPTPRLCGEVPGVRRGVHPLVASGQAEQF